MFFVEQLQPLKRRGVTGTFLNSLALSEKYFNYFVIYSVCHGCYRSGWPM